MGKYPVNVLSWLNISFIKLAVKFMSGVSTDFKYNIKCYLVIHNLMLGLLALFSQQILGCIF